MKLIASGIETELTIAINELFSLDAIYKILHKFYAQNLSTRIKVIREVYGGSWDAIVSGRAAITLGAPGERPSALYSSKLIGTLEFCFAVGVNHPLANLNAPLMNSDIMQYRAIAAADSSRVLTPYSSGILAGQNVLTVPDMHAKLQAQIAGLGVGYLPKRMAEHHANKGELVIKTVAEPKPECASFLAWNNNGGKAQQWLVEQLKQLTLDELLSD